MPEKGIEDIAKDLCRILKKHLVWIGRVLGILGVLSIFLHYFRLNLWNFLNIEPPELVISISLLFFWFSIEIINKIPELIEKLLKAEYKLKNPKFKEVRREIEEKFNNSKKIKIFSYTGETLDDYLSYGFVHDNMLNGLEVQLLCRNRESERIDQEIYNNSNSQVVNRKKRPWNKVDIIQNRATHFRDLCANTRVKLKQKFYDFPPIYQGYIFDDKEAYIGEYEWQEDPNEGGSQYKGSGRPLTYYYDETELGKAKIKVLVSRFEHLWG